MYLLIPILMAVAPAIFLVWYYYRKDQQKPEPKGLILKIFFLGVVVIIPVILVEMLVQSFGGFLAGYPLLSCFFTAFVVAGLCEEYAKLLIVKKFAYHNVHFDEVMDGIVYTIVASLGFACLENIMYVIGHGIGVAVIRAFTAVPMHALASGMMGYYVGKAKFAIDKKTERRLIRKGLWIAILIHGVYDFFLFAFEIFGGISLIIVFGLLIGVFFILRRNIKIAISEDMAAGRIQTS